MTNGVQIVDRGRGPQLATSRITVQDVVPYLQRHCSYPQIQEVMPSLSVEEIQVIERYVQDNYAAVMEQDRRIRERAEARRLPAEQEETLHRQRLERLEEFRQMIRQQKQERNGDRAAS